jgi:hypothetical protein
VLALPFSSVLKVLALQYKLYAKELLATDETKAGKLYFQSSKILEKASGKLAKGRDLTEKEKGKIFWLSCAVEEELWKDAIFPGAYASAKAEKGAKVILPMLKKAENLIFKAY